MSQAVIERPRGFIGALGFGRTVGGGGLSAVALAAMVAASVAVQLWAPAQLALEFDRHAIAAGQWWRLLSGNLMHYSWLHLAADAWPFAVLCYLARRQGMAVAQLVLMACAAIGLGVYFLDEGIDTYRGLSGVDMALLAAVLTRLARRHGGVTAALCVAAIALETIKAIFDAATGGCALPTILPSGIRVVAVAHLAGLAVGMVAGWPGPSHL